MRFCCLVTELCPTFCEPMDCSLLCSSVPWILQARILEWVAISFSRGSSDPGIEPASLASTCTGRQVCYQLSHQGRSKYFFFIDLAVLSLSCDMLDLLAAACRILSCDMWNLVPLSGIKPGPPALGAWSLNHRTTRPPQESIQEQVSRGKCRRV